MNTKIFGAIVDGWGNLLFQSPKHEELAKVRAEICAKCEHATLDHPFKKYIPEAVNKKERIQEIKGLGCNICHCPLSSKVRTVLSNCPLDKW